MNFFLKKTYICINLFLYRLYITNLKKKGWRNLIIFLICGIKN